MSTRRAVPNSPLSQERYMSSPEFAELRGISATAVAKRCALLLSAAKRELLWFIQGISLQEGGLARMAKELVSMFPQRCHDEERAFARAAHCSGVSAWGERDHARTLPLREFLIDICINPRRQIQLNGEDAVVGEIEADHVKAEYRRGFDGEFLDAELDYFARIIDSVAEYKRRYEERVRTEFCLTAIGRQIWEQLDYALKSRAMVLVDGLEGRGKTEAVRAWCDCHLGVARFVTLDGTNTKTAHFTSFAEALGVGHGNSHKVSQMQANVKEVLQASGLMPVIDEAHYFFNQAPRVKTRPEMLDFVDTALCNPPMPVALITTPQFLICMERAASQVGWNYRQFRRRCKRYTRLPLKNTPGNIEAVARHLLPDADKKTLKAIMGYEAICKRDLSAVGDVVREAKILAEAEGAKKVTFEHVKRAIHEVLLISDTPWKEMEDRLKEKESKRRRKMSVGLVYGSDPSPEPVDDQEPGVSTGTAPALQINRQARPLQVAVQNLPRGNAPLPTSDRGEVLQRPGELVEV